jgi:hypothetical protein
MPIFWLGTLLLCGFAFLDFVMRIRMKRFGYKWPFLQGGTLSYSEYLRLGREHTAGQPGRSI